MHFFLQIKSYLEQIRVGQHENMGNMKTSEKILTQFILDPTSFNLTDRIHTSDPIVTNLFKLSRDMCWTIHKERIKILQELSKKQTKWNKNEWTNGKV